MNSANKDEIIKSEIIEAASKVFQKWGYNKTTMEDIAHEANKGKSTLYYYYSSKEDIFYTFLIKCVNEILSKTIENMKKQTKAEDKLRTYIITFLDEIKNYGNLYDIARGEIKGHSHLVDRIRTRYDMAELNLIADIINLGIKSNEFKEYSEIDINNIAYSMVSSTRALLNELRVEDSFIYDKERMTILLDIFFNGIKK